MDVVYRASLLVFLCHHVCQVESRARRERTTLSSTPYPPSSSTPNPHRFVHLDCGSESNRLVQFLNFSVSPSPIRAPGRARLTTLVNVTERLPMTLSADVSVSKYFYGIPLKIPCFSNIGTCHYKDVCGLLETLFPTDKDCPRVLKKHRIPCRCPFEAGLYHLKRWLLPVPALRGIFESLATGEYDTRLRLYDSSNKAELACLQLKFNMKRQRKRKTTIKMIKPTTTTRAKTTTTTTTSNNV